VAKFEWKAENRGFLPRPDGSTSQEVSYSEFVQKYMEKNQPVVLTGLMDDWKACKDWVLDNGKPNLQFFSTHFGKSRVQVLFIVQ
jgi:hypothetical protein